MSRTFGSLAFFRLSLGQIYSAHCPNGCDPSFTVTIFDIHWPFSSARCAPSSFFRATPSDRTRHFNLNRNERTKREIKFDKFYLRKRRWKICGDTQSWGLWGFWGMERDGLAAGPGHNLSVSNEFFNARLCSVSTTMKGKKTAEVGRGFRDNR